MAKKTKKKNQIGSSGSFEINFEKLVSQNEEIISNTNLATILASKI